MNYHNITKDDMLNGDGLRVVLWVAGCNHQCPQCHNPITWDINGGVPFDQQALKEIYAELNKTYIKGITLSGGDPLHPLNRKDIEKLVKDIKRNYPDKDIWCYTGYSWDEVKDLNIMKYIDILVDGEFLIKLKNEKLHWRGSSNQKVIKVQESLNSGKVIEYN